MHHSGQVKINVLGGISVCAELLLSKGVTELISSKDIGNDRSKHLSPDPSLIIRLAAEFPPRPLPRPAYRPGQRNSPSLQVTFYNPHLLKMCSTINQLSISVQVLLTTKTRSDQISSFGL